jgi:hypothetical protein
LPGDVFEAKSKRDHRVLLATRKVEAVRDPAPVAPPPPAVAAKIASAVAPPVPSAPVGAMTSSQAPGAALDERVALRTEYEKTLGKPPFLGWSADLLREKIAAAKAGS